LAKIAIVGTGAMGSVYAGLLADAGNDVWAIDTWAEHVEAIRGRGLRVEGASGDRVATLSASVRAEDAGVCDLVVIATKAHDVAAAAAGARALLGQETVVLSIQNGLGSVERIAEVLGVDQLLVGVVGGFGAAIRAPGHVHHDGWSFLRIGEIVGPATARVHHVVRIWQEAGFPAAASDDAAAMVWEKFVCNVCFSGACTLTGMTIGEVMADPNAWQVAAACATEAWTAARALGIQITIEDPVAHVRAFGERIPDARPSMLLDHMAHRRSEVDVINGAVPVQARRAGVEAPCNEVVSALIRVREGQFRAHERGGEATPTPESTS
jgi:2-dehydropantoate 2-reductase